MDLRQFKAKYLIKISNIMPRNEEEKRELEVLMKRTHSLRKYTLASYVVYLQQLKTRYPSLEKLIEEMLSDLEKIITQEQRG